MTKEIKTEEEAAELFGRGSALHSMYKGGVNKFGSSASIVVEPIDEEKVEAGEYCRKGEAGCFCAVGWPYERQCPDCRDGAGADKYSYCVCPPVDRICPPRS
jgi:hypothetical protein